MASIIPPCKQIDAAFLARWNQSVPRYTSYPTAPQFYPLQSAAYEEVLLQLDQTEKPLSLYIHIPFCRSMCLFCGCSVILNRKEENQRAYVDLLLQEIQLAPWIQKRPVTQLHFGGGTPTSLKAEEIEELMHALKTRYFFPEEAEISMEVDPRTVFADRGSKLRALRKMGFNRVSFGVQDLDFAVQEAVKRRQTEEMTLFTYELAKELGFQGINLDLIYGLPLQTPEKFRKTAEKIAKMRPDRISFFSYANIPFLKAHQKAIMDDLPTDLDKFTIYLETRSHFLEAGYVAIGMDHFALPSDPLARGYFDGTLTRNFQGYSLQKAEDMMGLGVTSIGYVGHSYFQNVKKIDEYAKWVSQKQFPIERGFSLKKEDLLRKWVIETIMCRFALNKKEFQDRFGVSFDAYFEKEKTALARLESEGFLEETSEALLPTEQGRLFIRLIASTFDAYLKKGQYSRAV